MADLSLDTIFLVAAWLEAVIYGFFLCVFCVTMYITVSGERRDRHGLVMTMISSIMFFIATFHLAMNLYRLIRAYVIFSLAPGGPAAYIGKLPPWDHILKDTLYATQEILGGAAATYRTWVLWNHNFKIVALPICLVIVQIVSGYSVCGLYSDVSATSNVFDSRLTHWIKTFYSVAVVQNIITTSLMSYRIYSSYRSTAAFNMSKGLIRALRILLESAALQLLMEILLLSLYSSNTNAQYIVLESVAPVVGITFNAITIRIRLQSITANSFTSGGSRQGPIHTIGSLPVRRIAVNITQDIEMDPSASTTFDDDAKINSSNA